MIILSADLDQCFWGGCSFREHKTNDFVRSMVDRLLGYQKLVTVKQSKLAWFDPMTCYYILLKVARLRGVQRKNWITDVKKWTGSHAQDLITIAQDKCECRAFSFSPSIHVRGIGTREQKGRGNIPSAKTLLLCVRLRALQ